MPKILRRLRHKFMLMTTGIVAILVIMIATGYYLSTYNSSFSAIDRALEHAVNSSAGRDRNQNTQSENPLEPLPGTDTQNNPGLQNESPGQSGSGTAATAPESLDPDQRIDLFHGQAALVYTIVIDAQGDILRNDSPALGLDENILADAIDEVLGSEAFSDEEGSVYTGKLEAENLFYRAKVEEGSIYLGLTDSAVFDSHIRDALVGSVSLALLAIVLTVIISFFLARLFIRPVEESWNKQRRFIADASHELKTPLTVIMTNTEIVRSSPDGKIASEMKWLDGVMEESKRMEGLIADLLLLAKLDDEDISSPGLSEERVDFSQAVEDTLVSFEAIAFERQLTIEESIEPGIMVKGTASRLSRLPDILMDNARKYTEPGDTVKVSLSHVDDKAILRVFNSGSAIAKEDLDRVFDRFYRADESRCGDIPGYGLGLSIAQSIATESKGRITVENVDGEGVVFTVALPYSSSRCDPL